MGGPAAPSRLGDLLVKRALVTTDQVAAAISEQRRTGGQFATALIRLGIISEEEFTNWLRKEYRLPSSIR